MVWHEAVTAPAPVMPARRGTGWHARLELGFEERPDKTVIAKRRHSGPLTIQKPFYPEAAGTCHVYLLHPPGGVAGGDSLELEVSVGDRARALITTPAAGKFYRCEGKQASWRQRFRVNTGATLEWLPQETIVFDGSSAELCSRIEIEPDARFLGWETVCLGRPAAQESFTSGHFRQRLEIWRAERPVLIERSLFKGGAEMLGAGWGMRGCTVSATLVALPADNELLNRVRAEVRLEEPGLFGATLINDVLICRYLGFQAEHARRVFCTAWHVIRPHLAGHPACEPRIWNT
ncbi:MAG TPA: urease accessory protein UreD [Gammaproteobacteria bacterium]|nr:urease accessory protein UreD [Gammaproteobacteria bacterium]